MTIKIGFFPQNNTLWVLKHRGLIEEALPDIEWVDFNSLTNSRVDPRASLPTWHGDHLFDGSYDIIGTGATPPIAAQGRGLDIVHLAASEPRTANGRLVVHADSDIHDAADLKGRRIALAHGSWQSSLLLLALATAGLSWSDIVPVDTYENAGDQFLAREFDAWVGSYPDLTAVEAAAPLRDVIATDGLFPHRSIWFTRRDVVEENLDDVTAILAALDNTDQWIRDHPAEAAEYFTPYDGRPVTEWEHALNTRPWGLRPVGVEVVAEQQRAADLFASNQLIGNRVNVADTVIPEVNARVEALAFITTSDLRVDTGQ